MSSPPSRNSVPHGLDWHLGQRVLGQYLVRPLRDDMECHFAQGGMGRVYRVFHEGWGVDLAAKVPLIRRAGFEEDSADFVAEAQAWSALALHPNVVGCHYVRQIDGTPVIFAEFIDGGSLKEWIESGQLYRGDEDGIQRRVLDICIQMARGLHHAHSQGLIHHDFKPANVMMTMEGEAKVADFGQGVTPAYCSPEQAAMLSGTQSLQHSVQPQLISRATDIWSWAASVLEMLMGDLTWASGVAVRAAFDQALQDKGDFNGAVRIHAPLARILSRCLQPLPQNRFQNMAEVDLELREAFQAIVGEKYPRPIPRMVELRADNLNNKALSCLDLGDPEKARRMLEQALKADPIHPEATYNHGLLAWRDAHETDIAILARLADAGRQREGDCRIAYLGGLVHLERGDVQSAAKCLREATITGADQPEIRAALEIVSSLAPSLGQCIKCFEGHTGNVTSVAFASDGVHVVSGGWDNIVRVWNAQTGEQRQTFEGHQSVVNSLALSADSRVLVTGSGDKTVRIWDYRSGVPVRCLEGHNEEVNYVDVTDDGNWGVSGSDDKTIILWDLVTGGAVRVFKGHKGRITGVGIARDGSALLSVSSDGTLISWDPKTGRVLREVQAHRTRFGGEGVSAFAMCSDGRSAVTGGWDGMVCLWEMSTDRCVQDIPVAADHFVSAVAMSEDGRVAFSNCAGNNFAMWDTATGRCLRTFEGHENGINTIAVSPDGRRVATGSSDNTVRLWDVTPGKPSPHVLARPRQTAVLETNSIAFKEKLVKARRSIEKGNIPDAYSLVFGAMQIDGYSKSQEALDVMNGVGARSRKIGLSDVWLAHVLRRHSDRVSAVAFSPFYIRPSAYLPDQRILLSADVGGATMLWNVSKGTFKTALELHPAPVEEMAFFQHRKSQVYLRDRYGAERVYDTISGRRLWDEDREIHAGLGYLKKPVRVPALFRVIGDWNSDEEDQIVLPSGGLSKTRAQSWDGWSELFCDKSRNLVCSHSTPSGKELRTLQQSQDVTCVAVFFDGRFGISGSEDGTIRVWDLLNCECLTVLKGHEATVNCIACSQDGRWIASGSDDRTVRIWQLKWEYEIPDQENSDAELRHHLETIRELFQKVTSDGSVTGEGEVGWMDQHFDKILTALECAGLGHLDSAHVREKYLHLLGSSSGKILMGPRRN